MKWLETRIPPPGVAIVLAFLMGGLARYTPRLEIDTTLKLVVAILFFAAGALFDLAGLLSFRNAQTTINPMRPKNASALVDTGIYRITRNPMYVGLALELTAWACYLASPVAILGIVGFVLYIQIFQIRPEERMLTQLFGDQYRHYQARVRRWL